MAVCKVAGSRGYLFKRHVDFLKRHVNFQPYRQELPVRRRADCDAEAAEEVLNAEAESLVIAAAAFGHLPIHLIDLRPGIDATGSGSETVL